MLESKQVKNVRVTLLDKHNRPKSQRKRKERCLRLPNRISNNIKNFQNDVIITAYKKDIKVICKGLKITSFIRFDVQQNID